MAVAWKLVGQSSQTACVVGSYVQRLNVRLAVLIHYKEIWWRKRSSLYSSQVGNSHLLPYVSLDMILVRWIHSLHWFVIFYEVNSSTNHCGFYNIQIFVYWMRNLHPRWYVSSLRSYWFSSCTVAPLYAILIWSLNWSLTGVESCPLRIYFDYSMRYLLSLSTYTFSNSDIPTLANEDG